MSQSCSQCRYYHQWPWNNYAGYCENANVNGEFRAKQPPMYYVIVGPQCGYHCEDYQEKQS